ncbi:MAG: nucleotide exchange factor GrpE [Actinomycetota bacterium]
MSDHDEDERPTIKVTDKRRYHQDPTAPAEAGAVGGGTTDDAAVDPHAPAVEDGGPVASEVEPALADAEREAAEYLDHLRRLQAEFDNFRKRSLKQQTHAVELAAQPIVARLLEVVDDFELALMAAEQQPDFERFRKGVELVYAKLADVLRAEGLQQIEAQGAPFDPELHEALMQTGEGDGELVVADVLRPGYTLKGRVLRPAGVRVHKE